MPCNKCGKCCEVIQIRYSKTDFRKMLKEGKNVPDAQFILANWKRISRKEAKRINPNLIVGKGAWDYICIQYDRDKRRCKVYAQRPAVCRKFPIYKKLDSEVLHSLPECGFHEELQNESRNG